MTPVFPFYTAIYTAVLDQLVLRLSHRALSRSSPGLCERSFAPGDDDATRAPS
jgi:hypothetical protein